ncbi:MAG: type II toxin-antitoxin system PemK/MazF family toxin [Candidatus Sumerlaeota bacterium]|nr:type II toxin-antitoxin system PemK/MazF family toxin [Candidatus Sumerlaeota bacterium]
MRDYHGGEIVLLQFPYGDASSGKRRPALVLLDTGDDDFVLARVTTQAYQTEFDVALAGWREAGLLSPSFVRVHKLATLEKSLTVRRLGKLNDSDWRAVQTAFQALAGLCRPG